jgi:hypothetical protein
MLDLARHDRLVRESLNLLLIARSASARSSLIATRILTIGYSAIQTSPISLCQSGH